ncbi:sigma 54-interacting transcriptional regulator [Ammoniphilus sp. 3BR4]|uniref:sigma 54-interacting transcriptional regulator n=1 Tax=Ammoniphilus sp. 3BR4 TaxID=3158265 RepID=UPI00346707FC
MRKYRVLEIVQRLVPMDGSQGVTAEEVARSAGILRHNASADLNELVREGLLNKSTGRPVRFWATYQSHPLSKPVHVATKKAASMGNEPAVLDIIGGAGSLRTAIEQAKAAMLYPPRGLPTLIVGPTGAGKSHLAGMMHQYAVHAGRIDSTAPFNIFNCADYAANPQLLLAQLFGYVKGAFTGADQTTPGLISQSENGVLFLDEIHRLPPDGQEMLFLLMDRGLYRMLGDGAMQRPASVMLIAATSEDPHSVLLKTLLRRFPVVISLPELQERSIEERLALTELFLQEEATRVGIPISVSPLVLIALLTFRTVGNVGELRSAILLGCAKAFLNYIAAGHSLSVMPVYLTHLAPHIQLDYLKNSVDTTRMEQLVGVEDRIYYPQPEGGISEQNERTPLDFYSDLRRRMSGYLESNLETEEVQKLIQIDVDYYLRRLLMGKGSGLSHIPAHFLDVVASFVEEAGRELGNAFGPEVITALALHLVSSPRAESSDMDRTLALVAHCSREYGVVSRLAEVLEKKLEITLTPGEISFLALFLAAHGRKREQGGIAVLVIAHGYSTASSMAEVANSLLGEKRAVGIDMPLDQSIEDTLQIAIQSIKDTGKTKGVLLLVDMGSLTGFAPYLERACDVPVKVIPLVTTAAVIEASRLCGESDADLAAMERAIKQVYQYESSLPLIQEERRVIITTCLTGQGTARKLAAFLAEAFPAEIREEVIIQPVDVENGSEIPRLLVEGWRGMVIASTGTVDPHIPGIPFIGMEQILFGEGIQKLVSLVNEEKAEEAMVEVLTRKETVELARRFVVDYMDSQEGHKFVDAAVAALDRLELGIEKYVTPSQAARWVIHFSFALERLCTDGSILECSELDALQQQHSNLLDALHEAVREIEEQWTVAFPVGEIGFLALIVLSSQDTRK